MKCDDVNTSDDEDDDEEIRRLKEQLQQKRQEKKQGRHLKEAPAFSDETTHSTTSEPSTATTSSQSLWESDDELSRDWEAVSPTDEQMEDFGFDMPASTPKIGSPTEIKASSQLSAEAVAKSLLQKFAKTSHPAACELQWLFKYQDAPQTLVHSIFRRKLVMAQQNFRCAGCGMAVAQDYIKRFRYCHYLGKYFCSSCHTNALEVIPANVIRKWDFAKYEVSNFARDLLQKIHLDPLFHMIDLNASLYKKHRVLDGLKDIRQQLHYFKTFMQTCRKANE
ncbi:PREDICTED: run domain Beclin-1-interacting and cysteine-rich domain-containing protein-like [Acropora digitifera]|uniref:run domain Beclin-1-interacting and cysteine-rich domain-containing protein-like n=1 Tax=Acropora digitifera TaxID=70779 RepID=UPI000779FDC9|nr:PREDICTED: run domain Beclin-1-interacting and cysteine-rich domain-containing protein-like [Acropora digitifera]